MEIQFALLYQPLEYSVAKVKPIRPIHKFLAKHIGITLLLLALLDGRAISAPVQAHPDPNTVYPVININTSQKSISKNGLSAIFKMRLRHWSDGSNVTVFVLQDDDPLNQKFCKQILNVFPHQMRRNWNKLVFSGTGQSPILLEKKDQMIEKLRSTPGAVGYLSGADITEGIKILDIE